jgi:hypothetical protein
MTKCNDVSLFDEVGSLIECHGSYATAGVGG